MSIFRRHPSGSSGGERTGGASAVQGFLGAVRGGRPAPATGALFTGRADAAAHPLPGAGRAAVTLIAAGTRLRGEVSGATELQIEGEIEGEVRVEAPVVVGAEGRVVGPVYGQVVHVAGKVIGNVRAADRVELGPSGSLEGDIAAPRVVIAEGAFLKGKIEMMGEAKREPSATPPPGPESD